MHMKTPNTNKSILNFFMTTLYFKLTLSSLHVTQVCIFCTETPEHMSSLFEVVNILERSEIRISFWRKMFFCFYFLLSFKFSSSACKVLVACAEVRPKIEVEFPAGAFCRISLNMICFPSLRYFRAPQFCWPFSSSKVRALATDSRNGVKQLLRSSNWVTSSCG